MGSIPPEKIRLTRLFFLFLFLSLSTFIFISLIYPETNHLYLWLFAAVSVLWLFRARYLKKEVCLAFILSQICLMILFYPSPSHFLRYIALAVLPPWVLLWAGEKKGVRYDRLFAGVFLLCLCGDLMFSLNRVNVFYPSPAALFSTSTKLSSPPTVQNRRTSPKYPKRLFRVQIMRYIGLVQQKPYAFSPVFPYYQNEPFEKAISAKRYNSYLLLERYFELIHSGLPVSVLESFFRVNKSPVALFEASSAKLKHFWNLSSSKKFSHSLLVDGPESTGLSIIGVTNNTLEVNTQSELPRTLYWADGYHPYWNAYLNGEPVTIEVANGNFKSVSVPSGKHTIRFEYRPTKFIVALCLFYASFIGVITCALGLFLYQRFFAFSFDFRLAEA